MAGIAIMLILSTVAVQEWKEVLRRDAEAEMMFRAQDIVRAIRRYQKDRGALPTEMKQLMEPGNKRQYFLRHLYKDPLVRGGKWGLLYSSPQGGLVDPSAPAAVPGASGQTPTSGASGLQISPLNPGGPTPTGISTSQSGQTGEVTGLPIAGVKSLCKDKPFRVYQDQTEYARWLFSIFDLTGQPGAAGRTGNPPPSQGQRAPGTLPPPPRPPGGN